MEQYGIGVDIGGTTIKMGLFLNEKLLDKWEIPTNAEENGGHILEDIAASIGRKIEEKMLDKKQIVGIGLGVPGPVDTAGVVDGCVNLGWGRIEVEKELLKLTGIRVKAGNDANVAALGEMWQGGAKGSTNVIMVTLGTGVGGGIITDGRLVAGHHGAGGEIGHITVNPKETIPCNCGKFGCLEQYVSATGIVDLAKKRLKDPALQSSLLRAEELTAKDVFDEAKKGDAVASAVVEEVGEILGYALADVACVTDPEVIVIGGGVSNAGEILLDAVRKNYEKRAFHACSQTEFALASLGNDAGIYGSVRMVIC